MIQLRTYQDDLKVNIYRAWDMGFTNVLARSPTGSGKTVLFSALAQELSTIHRLPVVIAVHRKELVSQIALTLSGFDIYHNIIASRNTIRGIISEQRKKFGKQYYSYKSDVTVVSVDTLNARIDQHRAWANSIKVWIVDEATHLLKNNKWGKCIDFFPNAKGLGVTATPQRLDRNGLGSHAKGVFDTMVHGPEVAWLINQGYLCNYKMAFPKSDYEAYLRKAASDHDFTHEAMAQASAESHIVGDVVENYQKFCPGKQAIVFATDTMSATRMEFEFVSKGISAKLLTGNTPDAERLRAMDEYRDGRIKVLINIDLFDEGLDVPGIEAVFMARPTMSLSKYLQICGRVLRPVYAKGYDLSTKEGRLAAQAAGPKPFGLIVDHVGNRKRHGLPDDIRSWTLDDITRRSTVNLYRTCQNVLCNAPFDKYLPECPYCGTVYMPEGRSSAGGGRIGPQQVDGDLVLMDPQTIRELEGSTILESPAEVAERVSKAAGSNAGQAALRNQQIRIATQKELVQSIAKWAGVQRQYYNLNDRTIHMKFWDTFGKTITQALGSVTREMEITKEQVDGDISWAHRALTWTT